MKKILTKLNNPKSYSLLIILTIIITIHISNIDINKIYNYIVRSLNNLDNLEELKYNLITFFNNTIITISIIIELTINFTQKKFSSPPPPYGRGSRTAGTGYTLIFYILYI